MKDLIDPRTGQLLDFFPRQGDPPGAFAGYGRSTQSRRRWGRRVQLTTPASTGALADIKQRALFVTTEDLGRTYPILTRMRFAHPLTNEAEGGANTNEPTIYSPQTPFLGLNNTTLRITVRKTSDERSSPEQDTFDVPLGVLVNGTAATDSIPFDILEARHLSIEAELIGTAPNNTIWVECVSTIVSDISDLDRLTGWVAPLQRSYNADNVNGQLFLIARASRRQFIVCNTSADADLALFFTDQVASVGPATLGFATIVLPAANRFSTYESPIGGYNGPIVGLWYGAVATGFGLVTDGASYLP